MTLLEHTINELKIAGLLDSKDGMQSEMNKHILKMVEEFSKEGHSGFSASYAINQLNRLLNFLPITPLTGEDKEWEKVDNKCWQNKRCSRIFKDKNGAYDIEGYFFENQNGATFTNIYCRKPVEFPYIPAPSQKIQIYEEPDI